MRSLIFARVEQINTAGHFMDPHKSKHDAGVKLSTGHYLFTSNQDLEVQQIEMNEWRFFVVEGGENPEDKRFPLVTSEPVLNYDLEQLDIAFQNLSIATEKMCKAVDHLNKHDRELVMRGAGLVLTGAATAGSLIGAWQALFGWEPLNLTLSTGAAVLFGTLTYLQYESLSDNLKESISIVKRWKSTRKDYSLIVQKYCPHSEYNGYQILNTAHQKLCSKVVRAIHSKLSTRMFSSPIAEPSMATA